MAKETTSRRKREGSVPPTYVKCSASDCQRTYLADAPACPHCGNDAEGREYCHECGDFATGTTIGERVRLGCDDHRDFPFTEKGNWHRPVDAKRFDYIVWSAAGDAMQEIAAELGQEDAWLSKDFDDAKLKAEVAAALRWYMARLGIEIEETKEGE